MTTACFTQGTDNNKEVAKPPVVIRLMSSAVRDGADDHANTGHFGFPFRDNLGHLCHHYPNKLSAPFPLERGIGSHHFQPTGPILWECLVTLPPYGVLDRRVGCGEE